jgi:hypothetical protein
MSFKKITSWKVEFLKNATENGGAMTECIKNCKENQIIIHSFTTKFGRMWGCVEPLQLLKLIEKNKGLYEVITKYPHKVYFDIDCNIEEHYQPINENEYLEDIKKVINEYFPNCNFAISGSITDKKISYHIVLNNYTIKNEDERNYMKYIVKYINENINNGFDWKVYTKNRNMKIINQSKPDGRIQEIIEDNDFKNHCITCFINDYPLQFKEIPEQVKLELEIAKSKGSFDLGQLPKMILKAPEEFCLENSEPIDILNILPIDKNFNHSYTHLVARYCYYNNISFDIFISWLKNKHSKMTNEIINKWSNHWSNLNKFPDVSKNRMKCILKYYYPNITKDIFYRKFNETFNIPTNYIEKIETISQFCFSNPNKYLLFNVGMGGGKTAQTITYLKNRPSFLWITPNIALANNTKKRFELENTDIDIYNDKKFKTQQKKDGILNSVNKLLICLNSLHYITKSKYDVLVIDEIETLIDKFLDDFLDGKENYKKIIWNTFINLFRTCKKVILLDAFITTKTINLLKYIDDTSNITIFERINEPSTRTIKWMKDQTSMISDIINKLKDGNKLFIFYPYKNGSKNFIGMKALFDTLTLSTNKTGCMYNADVDDTIKKGLQDVNTNWNSLDFVITNNIITCGINYENLDFDYKFIFIGSFNSPRDIIQVSYRARHLSSGIIKVCYLGRMTQTNSWLNDKQKIDCNIYNKVYDDILIEKKSPLKRTFQLFCYKANYKLSTDTYKINELVEKEINDMLIENSISLSFNSIPDIDTFEVSKLEEKIIAQEATMEDKYKLNKYFFVNSFTKEANKEYIASIWDEKYIFFFSRLATILNNKNNLFNEIANFNDFPYLFPPDMNAVDCKFLNEELKERIFKEFTFKFIKETNNTGVKKLYKEVYNKYFGMNIITYTIDKSKNMKYEIDENVFNHFSFAKEYLILDYLTYMTYNKSTLEELNDACIEI